MLRNVRYQIDADRMLYVERQPEGFESHIQTIPSRTDVVAVTGNIRGSLFNAVTDAGESPELAVRLAEIFAWDLDFYTDTRAGDTFHVLVEKKLYLNGQTAGYGRILAAEYKNAGHPYQAVLFHDATGAPGYFQPGWRRAAESVSAIAAEIRRAGHIAFQPIAFSSNFENLSRASRR